MKLKDKVTIVTGGSSGIGLAIVKLFIKEGAKVLNADIINNSSADFIKTDVRKEQEIINLIENVTHKYKAIDVLINNTGIGKNNLIENVSQSEWDNIINTNLRGYFLMIKHIIPILKKQKKGVIINIASELAFVGDPGWAAYASSKGGIIQLTKVAAIELINLNIRVNALCPGPTETPMLTKGISQQEKERITKLIPMGRLGKPEEIAQAALFLASDDCQFMTGSNLIVDGGILAKE